MKKRLLILLAVCVSDASAQGILYLPEPIENCMLPPPISENLTVVTALNPFYLRGDFDGDGQPDHVVLVKSKKSNEEGLLICFGGRLSLQKLGAGNLFKLASGTVVDLKFDSWEIHPKSKALSAYRERPPVLRGDAIHINWEASASGVIYWTGKEFAYYLLGD